MARGKFSKTVLINTATDTAIIAAPTTSGFGAPERIYLIHASIRSTTSGAGFAARLEDGVGGTQLLRGAFASADIELARTWDSGGAEGDFPGYALTEGNALNCNTSGTPGAVYVTVVYEVK